MAPTRPPILAVLAHPDDELLGCGATLLKWKDAGHPIHVAFAGFGRLGSTQARDAVRVADQAGWRVLWGDFTDNAFGPLNELIEWAEGIVQKVKPWRVIGHNAGDINQDHHILAEATRIACRPHMPFAPKELWVCEVPGGTLTEFWSSIFFDAGAHWERKMRLLKEYQTEYREHPHPRSAEAITARARYWGSLSGFDLAEAFRLEYQLIGQTSGTAS